MKQEVDAAFNGVVEKKFGSCTLTFECLLLYFFSPLNRYYSCKCLCILFMEAAWHATDDVYILHLKSIL